MRERSLEVDRSTAPCSMEISSDDGDLTNPHAYVAKVSIDSLKADMSALLVSVSTQVVLEHLDREGDNKEVVHAKFVLGSDGTSQCPRSPRV